MKLYLLNNWPKEAAFILHSRVEQILNAQGSCTILLTGGRSGALLYGAWSSSYMLKNLKNVFFYLGDERCVPFSSPQSNYHLVMCNLFPDGIPLGCQFHGLNADTKDIRIEIIRYANLLPEALDIALFGIGDDGHIASLFPGSSSTKEIHKKIIPIIAPIEPNARITITPRVIRSVRTIFALAPGPKKAAIYHQLQGDDKSDITAIPARLLANASWLVESKYF